MNSDIFIRVIDWFVSICETHQGKRLMGEAGFKKKKGLKRTSFARSLSITLLEINQNVGRGHRSEKRERRLTHIN